VRDRVAETAAAEVDADPQRVRLVGEHVDVVVSAADRAQLRPRLLAQVSAMLRLERVPGGILEQRMRRRGIVGAILPAHAKADHIGDFAGESGPRALDLPLCYTASRQ